MRCLGGRSQPVGRRGRDVEPAKGGGGHNAHCHHSPTSPTTAAPRSTPQAPGRRGLTARACRDAARRSRKRAVAGGGGHVHGAPRSPTATRRTRPGRASECPSRGCAAPASTAVPSQSGRTRAAAVAASSASPVWLPPSCDALQTRPRRADAGASAALGRPAANGNHRKGRRTGTGSGRGPRAPRSWRRRLATLVGAAEA